MRRVKRELESAGLILASLGATPDANRLYHGLGMREMAPVPRYVALLRSGPVVTRYLTRRRAGRLAAGVLNAGLRALTWVELKWLRRLAHGTTMTEVDTFSDNGHANALDEDSRPRLKQNLALLNWRIQYARSIAGARIRAMEVLDDSGHVAARAVVRIATHERLGSQQFTNVRLARVLELTLAPSPPAAVAALFHVLSVALEERCDVLEVAHTSPAILKLCQRLSFVRSGGLDLYVSRDPRRNSNAQMQASSDSSWALSMMASENAFY